MNRLSPTESIAAGLLAVTGIAGVVLGMTTIVHPWIVASIPVFMFVVWLLRLPSWTGSLIVALPMAALLTGRGILQIYGVILEWQAIATLATVTVLFLSRKRLPEIMPPVGLLLAGLLPVMLCGVGSLLYASWHYDWGFSQVAETALPALQAAMFMLAAMAVCARRISRSIVLLALVIAAIMTGL